MGMFDEVLWEAELPTGHPQTGRLFQTKSLERCLDRYVVNKAGRLLLVGGGLLVDGPPEGTKDQREGTDVEFHGDMRLVSSEGGFKEYVARFTHGTLEWIRPIADVPWAGRLW